MNLPTPFISNTRALLGNEEYEKLFAAWQQQTPVSIRVNVEKLKYTSTSPVPWCADGHYLDKRLTFTFDPLFHAGCYYVQEASSMFVEQVMKCYVGQKPTVMLDLCAAPGGKSTHARSLLPQGSLLVANEVIRNRSQILAENLTKWGREGVVVTNNNPADFAPLRSFFDVILADVPCSGEGMFRKDAGAIEEWSPANVELCWQRQRRIIADIWPCLRPGGVLIYSTCTYNTKENEENVQWMCSEFGAEALAVDISASWQVTGNLLSDARFPVYRFLPHKTRGEGFFLAAVRKPFDAPDAAYPDQSPLPKKKQNVAASLVSKEQLALAQSWLTQGDTYDLSVNNTSIIALSNLHRTQFAALQQHLRIVQAGVALGEVKGKDLIPAHALAMSLALNPGIFSTQELTYEQAIAYLRKEAISLPEASVRGYLLVAYKGTPLGFVKNIGNRANNLYPQEWRIRSGYLPDVVLAI